MSALIVHAPTTDVSSRKRPGDWRDDALCVQVDTEVFFPDKGEGVAEAKFLCGRCPVRQACLAAVMELEGDGGIQNRHGVWGGLTATERAELARAQGRRGETSICPVCGKAFHPQGLARHVMWHKTQETQA